MLKDDILLYKFNLPLFKSKVWIIVAKNLIKAIDFAEDRTDEKIAKEEHKKHLEAYSYAYHKETGGTNYILFLKYNAKPGTIAHEAKHIINWIFHWHGYKISTTNDELECSYLEDIVNRCHNTINRYKKLKKK